jgi:hypothetical protein
MDTTLALAGQNHLTQFVLLYLCNWKTDRTIVSGFLQPSRVNA